ncbi:hypothetical protein [Cohnella faecalis]|uniref:Aldehyde oxidase/xanthine dehydrogenase a/b hammerhead domain-containing protein n=1 Tax=Cohnella faecalis TaxID=2315694 RepID=A0A398CKM1_9BACL|nr:hypothetical protein D3H35_11185 [Cohnella faecalis]
MGLVTKEKSGSRWRIRPDGPAKVTGSLVYLTDMRHPDELIGAVLRSEHPHALIRSISTEKAVALPGVHAVLTWRDVPGLNGFGIAKPDQPVFCEDKVRYVGDAVAAVAADSREIAAEALALIEVDYELLPVVDEALPFRFGNVPATTPHPSRVLLRHLAKPAPLRER